LPDHFARLRVQPGFTVVPDCPEEAGAMTLLSVVIPAYNEEDAIAAIVERVLAVRPALAEAGVSALELVVVDDGSRDRTAAIVRQYACEGVRLVRHQRNRGYGAALKSGFCSSRGQLLGFLDADGTYPPEQFPELCRAALAGADLVIGSRMAGAASEMPAMRRLGNRIFAALVSLVGAQPVSDSASGMRVFRREALERLYPLPNGLNFTPVMSTRAIHEGLRMVEVPITYSERVGRSKLSVVRDGWRFLNSIVWTALSYNPVRILGALGLAGVGLALLVGLGLVAARAGGQTALGPWGVAALFAGAVSAVGGLSVFSLGITFNYLVALFYKRPVRQGLFGRPILPAPVERHFGWLGLVGLLLGGAIAAGALALGVQGWAIDRLWLYLLGSALMMLMGLQLMLDWVLLRVLEELSQRELLVDADLARERPETFEELEPATG
jgi:hypothetical protein